MNITGQNPTTRVQFTKSPAVFLVIADDRDAITNWGECMREGRLPARLVVHVERQADHPDEREAQWDELSGSVLDAGSESLSLLTVRAVSHAHAAAVARHEYAVFNAAVRMGEVIDTHLEYDGRGWIAVRIADGGSDGELYGDYEQAFAAQKHPEACAYFPISPLTPWTPRMCEEFLEDMTHLRHGCMVYGRPTCR
ncbi:hypothetical protein [Streptomyces salinarius]|uniref:hypothetical protein n=1 Tax=Streptomyces salinarius TaxID=2762598 RepID=UPI0016449BDE|nr:hypothetical protein [Streptomyces salinarius]